MKTRSLPSFHLFWRSLAVSLTVIAICTLGTKASAATQAWTNAPVDSTWVNTANWVSKAVPGTINGTGNAVNGDTAVFTNPIPASGLGGAAHPIYIDDATIAADRSREIGNITFDTATCGAYVFTGDPAISYPNAGILYLCMLNSTTPGVIQMTAPVVNSETFELPILIRLPSSTAGIADFINNAALASATMQIDSVTNDSANTRGTTFVLDGSNTGTNTIYELSQDGIFSTGVSSITKQGTGTWVLPGVNSFRASAPILIDNGLLIVQNAAAFGSATTATVVSNGVLRIDAVTLNQTTLTLNNGGTVRMNGSATVNGVTVGTAVGTSVTLATTSASDVMTVGDTGNQPTGGASTSVLHVTGPGTVVLSQSANYVGKWSLDAGITQLGSGGYSGLGTGPNLNIGAGAIFDVSQVMVGGGTYTLGTVGISASGSGTGATAATINADPSGVIDLASTQPGISLTFTPTTFTGDSTHPSLYISQGTLSLNNNAFTINNATSTPLGVGTYKLIQQATGNITSGGGYSVVGVTGGGVSPGNVASVQVVNGEVDLVVSAYVAKNLVWTGSSVNANWDVAISTNWLNGSLPTVFNNSDAVTFNSVGTSNSAVNLVGTLAPSSVTVDTSGGNYSFNGSGQIAGATALWKVGSGTLVLNQVSSYGLGTIISNGVIQLGTQNAIPSVNGGDVLVVNSGLLDLNGNNETVNGLNGNGTIDTIAGGSPVLTVGNNNDSGTFSGIIQNSTGGSLGVTKAGTGLETLANSNSYSGPTVINGGVLRLGNAYALTTNANLTINAGDLDIGGFNPTFVTLAGAGNITNGGAGLSTISVISATANTFNGVIQDNGAGAGEIALFVGNGSSLRLNGLNTYSGGTIVATGASLLGGSAGTQLGTGGILVSNGATIGLPNTGSSTPVIGNTITTVGNATVTFTSSSTANAFTSAFVGGPTSTNVYMGNMSLGSFLNFSNFLGTVEFAANTTRFFGGGASLFGGTNTTFSFTGGSIQTRDATTVEIGTLTGGTGASGIYGSTVTPSSTYWIGFSGIDSSYEGVFTGSNSLVKVGPGRLTLDGTLITTNTDSATYTNFLYGSSIISQYGNTTISNGVLALSAPDNLSFSPVVTLAAPTAVLDAANMGYVTNFNDTNNNADSALITNGVFEVMSNVLVGSPAPYYQNQSLAGIGTIRGTLLADPGTTVSVGLPVGTLTVAGSVDIEGALNMDLDRTNDPSIGMNSELAASGALLIDGPISVTNGGPDLVTGDVYHLFNHAITGAWTLSLPVQNAAATITYLYQTNLATDGSIKVLLGAAPVNTTPTPITNSFSGGVLTLSWPIDHTGWRLQSQTNSIAVGLGTNWVTVAGSTTTNQVSLPANPADAAVFYRLIYP